MNKIEFIKTVETAAKDYRLKCKDSINRNKHMNTLNGKCVIDQETVDAVLVDFINHVAYLQGVDYGMYVEDLRDEN